MRFIKADDEVLARYRYSMRLLEFEHKMLVVVKMLAELVAFCKENIPVFANPNYIIPESLRLEKENHLKELLPNVNEIYTTTFRVSSEIYQSSLKGFEQIDRDFQFSKVESNQKFQELAELNISWRTILIISAICCGKKHKEIAEIFCVGVDAVDQQIRRIKDKLEIETTTELIRYFTVNNLVVKDFENEFNNSLIKTKAYC